MTRLRSVLLFLFLCLPISANAAVASGDFPEDTMWYMHADLQEMRESESGLELYAWFDDEVLTEVKDETGIDLKKEVDRITAFSNNLRGAVIVIEGDISTETRDKALAVAEIEGNLNILTYGKTTYYHVDHQRSDDDDEDGNRHRHDMNSLEESAYFTFDIKRRLIVTSDEDQIKALIDSNGKIAGVGQKNGTLFVLTAEKDFVQAGMRTKGFGDEIDWDSNILRNIEQAALLIADQDGMIAIEAKLVSGDPRMAESVASIINGLLSLQVFNSELDPELGKILQNTKVEVEDAVLSIKTVIDPATIVDIVAD